MPHTAATLLNSGLAPWTNRGNGILTADSDRLSRLGRRMSLFLQTRILRRVLFRAQEHRQEQMNLRAAKT